MAAKIVCYDLDKPGQDYKDLISRLEELGADRIQYSVWLINTNWGTADLRDDLRRFVDENDRIIVAGLDGSAAWHRLMVGTDRVKQILAA